MFCGRKHIPCHSCTCRSKCTWNTPISIDGFLKNMFQSDDNEIFFKCLNYKGALYTHVKKFVSLREQRAQLMETTLLDSAS